MPGAPILWRRLDGSGHESAQLSPDAAGWRLAGAAVFAYEGDACLLQYDIRCDAAWRTLAAQVTGWLGARAVAIRLARDAADHWSLNDADCSDVAGCLDLDLNFSPVTNLLPIRRLALPVGASAEVRAAWLRFPEFTLEPLPQVYRHTGEATWRYEASGGAFASDLTVNAAGFVTRYPAFWEAVDG